MTTKLAKTLDLVAKTVLFAVILNVLMGFSTSRTIMMTLGLALMFGSGYVMDGQIKQVFVSRKKLFPFLLSFMIGALLSFASLTTVI